MTDLHTISLEQKIKAFERARDESTFPEGRLILLSEEYYDAALTFASESFVKDEPISQAVNMRWTPAIREMWLETFRCNLTIALLDGASGDIIGIRGTRILDKNYKYDDSKIDDPGFKILWGIIGCCDERAKFFEIYQTEQVFQMFGFAVRHDFRKRGIGNRLFTTLLNMLSYLVSHPFCIKGETSSQFSSRVYEKNGFKQLYEMPFSDYLVDGKQVICDTGEHTALKIWGIQLNVSTT